MKKRVLISVLCMLLAVSLAACGSKNTDAETSQAESTEKQTTETQSADTQSTSQDPDIAQSGTTITGVRAISTGFCANRAWVRGGGYGASMIDTDGNVIFTIPAVSSGEDDPVEWEEFGDMINGAAYINGRYYPGNNAPISIIIDADGNEICRFESTDDTYYKIVGRSDDYFLVCALQKTVANGSVYLISIDTHGKMVGEPKLIFTDNEYQFREGSNYIPDVTYLGEDIFLLNGHQRENGTSGIGFYNCRENAFMETAEYEYEYSGKFCDGITILRLGNQAFIVRLDDLQKDNANLVLTEEAKVQGDPQYLFQYGKLWLCGRLISDQQGNPINVPEAFGNNYNVSISEDGYALIENGYAYAMIGPDGQLLYEPTELRDMSFEAVNDRAGGYATASRLDIKTGTYTYGIVDRAGIFHAYSEDLSKLPGLADLRFAGLGCGYNLIAGRYLGTDGTDDVVIRSLDGKTTIDQYTVTKDTVTVGDNKGPVFSANLK